MAKLSVKQILLLGEEKQKHREETVNMEETYLVGGFNPFEKYARQIGFIFPNFRSENKYKYLSCHQPNHVCS